MARPAGNIGKEKREMRDIPEMTIDQQWVSSEVRFYTIEDLCKMLGWSEMTLQKLFNDPAFPSADYGKSKVVEAHALIEFFSRKHIKSREKYWR